MDVAESPSEVVGRQPEREASSTPKPICGRYHGLGGAGVGAGDKDTETSWEPFLPADDDRVHGREELAKAEKEAHRKTLETKAESGNRQTVFV